MGGRNLLVRPDGPGLYNSCLTGATVEELANNCGLSPERLRCTVDLFNDAVDRDGCAPNAAPAKASLACRVEVAPFYAYKVCPTVDFTSGGIRCRDDGAVMTSESE